MDLVDFQEKMDQNHRGILCRMLGVKELPERLLEQYLQVKMMTDRIDAFISPGTLAIIAIMAGFGPEAEPVPATKETVEQAIEKPVTDTDESKPDLPSPKLAESEKSFWSPGMPVRVLHDETLKQGKIVSIIAPTETGQEIQLTIKFDDGTTVTVGESEVEAD